MMAMKLHEIHEHAHGSGMPSSASGANDLPWQFRRCKVPGMLISVVSSIWGATCVAIHIALWMLMFGWQMVAGTRTH